MSVGLLSAVDSWWSSILSSEDSWWSSMLSAVDELVCYQQIVDEVIMLSAVDSW